MLTREHVSQARAICYQVIMTDFFHTQSVFHPSLTQRERRTSLEVRSEGRKQHVQMYATWSQD